MMKIGSVVALLIVALAMPALADGSEPSVTTANVNLRAGAGVDYSRITTLPRGTNVSIDVCRKGWCLVETQDVFGWVSARYLAGAGSGNRPPAGTVERFVPPVVDAPPVAVFDFVPRNYHDLGLSRQHKLNRNFHDIHR